jgi:antitoxin YefM
MSCDRSERTDGAAPEPRVVRLVAQWSRPKAGTSRLHAQTDPATRTHTCTLFVVARQVPVREFRSRLSELLDDVADRRDHILVTRNGKPAAALVPIDEYQALEESAEILSDPDALDAIEAGLADLNRGDVVTLDALRSELAERRRNR